MSEPNNNHPDRRTFLQVAGAVVSASVSGIASAAAQGTPAAAPQAAGASFAAPPIPEVRIGFVGVGGQGGSHVKNMLGVPGVKITAVCDIAEDRVKNAQWLESLGCDYIIHHIGFDERGLVKGLSPMDELDAVVDAVNVPVQAVGGLTIPQAIECPAHGAPLVVLGAPLVIDANEFKTSSNDLHTVLREISTEIRKTPLKRWTAQGTRLPQEGK